MASYLREHVVPAILGTAVTLGKSADGRQQLGYRKSTE